MCVNSWFSTLVLSIAAGLRKVYAPVIYGILYILFFRKRRKELKALVSVNGFPSGLGTTEFRKIMKNLEYRPERPRFLDFTYLHPEFFLSDKITLRWGRDCDDFAHQWYSFFSEKGFDEVYSILLTTWKPGYVLEKSHIITIARNFAGFRDMPGHGYTLYDNNRYREYPACYTVEDVMKAYAGERSGFGEGYSSMVWVYYRKHKNYK